MPRVKQPPRGPIPTDGVVLTISTGHYDNEIRGLPAGRRPAVAVLRVEGEVSIKSELRFAKLIGAARAPLPPSLTATKPYEVPKANSPAPPANEPTTATRSTGETAPLISRAAEVPLGWQPQTPRKRRVLEARCPSPVGAQRCSWKIVADIHRLVQSINVTSASPYKGRSPSRTSRNGSPLPPHLKARPGSRHQSPSGLRHAAREVSSAGEE
ncbi:hypothetical protein DFJ77DRAFT_469712 [Powellomyces hirtus]|nr:hypothetical protein DFJ77DRAFT_469712 [Powellomyces hirtus]